MNLFYLLLNLNEFPDDHLIYAEIPWTLESKAISIEKNSNSTLSLNIDNIEYHYFLNIALAKKLLQIYSTNNVCLAETCQKVIEYALQEQNKIAFN
ncbi:hypothetical protein [Acinetobacter thermotolerans]|uniref:hypothetical protein n=1 Tax=Acinetobacter thermotolerans TaxID=3151487 RepID=UPI00325ABEBA